MISAVRELKPIWTTSTFLVYAGGLTVLGGGLGALGYLSSQFHGHGEQTAWALLIWVVLLSVAYVLRRLDRPIAAGIFAFVSVLAWIALVAYAYKWFGWTDSGSFNDFGQWSWTRLLLWLLILFAAADARRRFRFPFVRLISAVALWAFIIDLFTPGHGNVLLAITLVVGLLYLVIGNVTDKPSAFWLHLVAGLLVGVPILVWCHTTDFDFAVVSFMALVFVMWGYWTRRSSWAFWGTLGFFIATVHYLVGSPTGIAGGLVTGQSPDISAWSFPLGFGLLGFWLVGLGMLGKRRRHAAIVVETPAPAAPPAAPPPAAPPAE
jgi:hypothetical protein